LQIKPRLGPNNKNQNMITVIYDYKGEMICELQIKIVSQAESSLSHSNKLVYKIEKICETKDRYLLFEAYASSEICMTNHDFITDTSLTE